ncbi:MAG: TonB-dependent receptor [Bacteroidales bacterium]|nr:TonB-dependent receptor [Bacteroidales bacterium]
MKIALTAAALLLCVGVSAQQIEQTSEIGPSDDVTLNERIDSTLIVSLRASTRTPVAHTGISREELRSTNSLSSLPMVLSLQPSVVATNEGGTGLGYSKMRVRGSDASRINVTLNGVTINDAESQEVFWVNMPAISGLLGSVQLQRGVGTSVNGSGAFGASVNMRSGYVRPAPYAEIELSAGSFLTGTVSAAAGTGRMADGLSLDVRYAYNTTEGYLDNATARLHSAYAALDWYSGSNSLRLTYLMGKERTGLTWYGIPKDSVATNPRYNPATPGDTDNYAQHHVQGVYLHQFSSALSASATLNFTKGDGYYEYLQTDPLAEYYSTRNAMDNVYSVATANLKYQTAQVHLIANASYSIYEGGHYGYRVYDITQAGFYPDEYNRTIYDNTGYKTDASAFLRGEWLLWDCVNLYADMQYRHVFYRINGTEKKGPELDWSALYDFFNPKGGISWQIGDSRLYASVAVAHKEPARSDIKDAIQGGKADEILPERLVDWEFGYSFANKHLALGANIYLMEYKNQLVQTGKLSENGYSIKANVPRSYRHGIELTAAWKPVGMLTIDGNLTLSRNKILDYTNWVDCYDNPVYWTPLEQRQEYLGTTDLLLSPSVTGRAGVTLKPVTGLSLAAVWKYVGRQYYDNTSCEDRALPAYDVLSFSAEYCLNKTISFAIFAENILNKTYVADAWVYRAVFADGSPEYIEDGLFPQAPFNAMFKVRLTF